MTGRGAAPGSGLGSRRLRRLRRRRPHDPPRPRAGRRSPRCTLTAAPGAPAAATPAMGEEDYYLELCERPVHFEKANPVNCVFFDEANKQVRARRLLPRGPAPGVVPRAGLLPGTRPGASCRPGSGRAPAPRVGSAEEPGFTAAVNPGPVGGALSCQHAGVFPAPLLSVSLVTRAVTGVDTEVSTPGILEREKSSVRSRGVCCRVSAAPLTIRITARSPGGPGRAWHSGQHSQW